MLPMRSLFTHQLPRAAVINFVRYARKDPGVGLRKKIIPDLQDEHEPEDIDFDDLESDFMDAHKSFKQHVREIEVKKEQEKYYIVRQKYFKEKFPNFLTWHDKEQIKYLHRTDPEEWTIDKLSEGFPALPDTIHKILKGNWVKGSQQKITNHDSSVQKNWQQFKGGQMSDKLPPDLVQHLKKFTNRALNFRPFEIPVVGGDKILVKTDTNGKRADFSQIISSYKKLKNKSHDHDQESEKIQNLLDDKSINKHNLPGTNSKRLVTLEELQNTIQGRVQTGKKISEEEKLMITKLNLKEQKPDNFETQVSDDSSHEIIDLGKNKYRTSGTSVGNYVKKGQQDLSHLSYPEKIAIPRNMCGTNKIYKLNDCFYDYDGIFLYRVPGMG